MKSLQRTEIEARPVVATETRPQTTGPETGIPELPPELLETLRQHAEQQYPEEACGLVLTTGKGETSGFRSVPLVNSRDDRRSGFTVDPADIVTQLLSARFQGESPLALYHSHPDGAPIPSEEDRHAATDGRGRLLWPGIEYWILSVVEGRAGSLVRYRWEPVRARCCPEPVIRARPGDRPVPRTRGGPMS